mmetsp:Transcript_36022/g.87044  ORF Transcript_36022/g.87044 Transcript_36022/m.87044 type:complete len:219 (-) Transcript_36022:233-889(-)
MLRSADVKHMGKSGKQTLSMMKKLMTHVERAVTDIANRSDLIVKERAWTKTDCLKLYRGVKHFFQFPNEKGKRKRRYEAICWKTYYNLCMKGSGGYMERRRERVPQVQWSSLLQRPFLSHHHQPGHQWLPFLVHHHQPGHQWLQRTHVKKRVNPNGAETPAPEAMRRDYLLAEKEEDKHLLQPFQEKESHDNFSKLQILLPMETDVWLSQIQNNMELQ